MNFIKSILTPGLIGRAMMVAASVCGLSSCGVFDESLEPCPQGVSLRFVYDYNMEFANAFPSQVDCLTLLVYDAQGRYVATRTESADVLSDENYRMTLDLGPGQYSFLAYGGLECPEASFEFVKTPADGSVRDDVEVRLLPKYFDAAKGTDLHPLFYGKLDATVPESAPDSRYVEATVHMMKDTNNLRIVLQQINNEPIDDAEFEYYVTADNTLMNWENALLPAGNCRYNPWTRGVIVNDVPYDEYDDSAINAAYAEFSFGRLMAMRNAGSPRLVVRNVKSNFDIINIPLVDYLLLLKSDHFASMGNQEFLDRESRWNMIFFLDENHTWLRTHIVINNWVVRINPSDF